MGLIESWKRGVGEARAWEPGDDLAPVLSALALTVALELTGELARVSPAEREALKRIGQRALLHVGGSEDEEELEALRLSAALARDGLRALSGRAPAEVAPLKIDLPIPAEEVARLVEGRLDGLRAAALAMRVRRDPKARAELGMLLSLAEPEVTAPLRLAAADAAALFDPSLGRLLGVHELGVEAVVFEGEVLEGEPTRVALYADAPVAVRLSGEGLTTEDARAGYWLGRVDGRARVEATLHAGDETAPWVLVLSPAPSGD